MASKTFEVPNIHCMGCVNAIKFELGEMPGVTSVRGDADTRRVEVAYDAPASWDGIVAALKEIDYPPASA